ncbi:GH3 auxin-responsive promoter [Fodinibius roseus]|uniref:GH3 auxin-responsive promoter n=1 Tax=Fodinibius roseus TaxID=1194090 RepID=A0A1M4TE10_9BACT|nr:GH3 auxin-responsive promoter family protein [Fodinibius roseus]SHE42681.1 GH3 auxin-responsive promoter [Fodinibius roseus]
MDTEETQQKLLTQLIDKARETTFGREHHFGRISCYEVFRKQVPISFYKDIAGGIGQMKKGASDIFWPGRIDQFAVSAGTSGEGKHLPLSDHRLKSDRRFMRKIAVSYLQQRPNFLDIIGTHISLPGFLEKKEHFDIGEISAFSAQHAPFWLTPLQFFNTDELVNLPFRKKIERILGQATDTDVRVMTAAPNWVLTIFQRLLEQTGKKSIAEIWPNLKLLICGGVKLDNYRPHIQSLLGSREVDFIETYGASEGYIAFSDDLQKRDLKLIFDNGIFYEFIPHPHAGQETMSAQQAIPLWEVQTSIPYAVLVTTNAGLWRYALNDIVEFQDTRPPRIKVRGRVSEMLDDFGEALYAYEAAETLHKTAEELSITVGNFTVGAQMPSSRQLPRHYWFIQTSESLHSDTLRRFAKKLDAALQQENRHYAIRRESETMGAPKVLTISQQQINTWLHQKDKEKAQGKLPSMLRDDSDIDFFRNS